MRFHVLGVDLDGVLQVLDGAVVVLSYNFV